jgi:hypothetical protein
VAQYADGVLVWSEATLAIIGAIGAVWIIVKSIYRMARNIERLVETSESNALKLVAIEKQVTVNGGTSLKDAVNRIDVRLERMEKLPCHLHAELAIDEERGT